VKPYVAELIDAFGTQRTMFATNWPISTISATYDLWVDTLVQILDELGLTQEQKDDVMWRTASRHYRIQWPQ
jgi:L-fuconolactonase